MARPWAAILLEDSLHPVEAEISVPCVGYKSRRQGYFEPRCTRRAIMTAPHRRQLESAHEAYQTRPRTLLGN